MNFLFDKNGRSIVRFCEDWAAAEKYAKDHNLTLLGEFIGNV